MDVVSQGNGRNGSYVSLSVITAFLVVMVHFTHQPDCTTEGPDILLNRFWLCLGAGSWMR